MKDKRIEHINNVIQPRDVDQFIRSCYLNLHGDLSNEEFDGYIDHVRKQAFENGYTEEDLGKIIEYAKELSGEGNVIKILL